MSRKSSATVNRGRLVAVILVVVAVTTIPFGLWALAVQQDYATGRNNLARSLEYDGLLFIMYVIVTVAVGLLACVVTSLWWLDDGPEPQQ